MTIVKNLFTLFVYNIVVLCQWVSGPECFLALVAGDGDILQMIDLDVTFDCANYLFFPTHRAPMKSVAPRISSRCHLHHLETSLVELFEINARGVRCRSHLSADHILTSSPCFLFAKLWLRGNNGISSKVRNFRFSFCCFSFSDITGRRSFLGLSTHKQTFYNFTLFWLVNDMHTSYHLQISHSVRPCQKDICKISWIVFRSKYKYVICTPNFWTVCLKIPTSIENENSRIEIF